jgi:hypothetical protein
VLRLCDAVCVSRPLVCRPELFWQLLGFRGGGIEQTRGNSGIVMAMRGRNCRKPRHQTGDKAAVLSVMRSVRSAKRLDVADKVVDLGARQGQIRHRTVRV